MKENNIPFEMIENVNVKELLKSVEQNEQNEPIHHHTQIKKEAKYECLSHQSSKSNLSHDPTTNVQMNIQDDDDGIEAFSDSDNENKANLGQNLKEEESDSQNSELHKNSKSKLESDALV